MGFGELYVDRFLTIIIDNQPQTLMILFQGLILFSLKRVYTSCLMFVCATTVVFGVIFKHFIPHGTHVGRSFMYIRKRTGHKALLCDTVLLI